MKSYYELLKSPHWQKKRLEILEAANWSCDNCGDKEKTLNVHHRIYIKGRKPWEYENDQLEALCEECHKTHHAMDEAFKLACASSGFCLRSLGAGFLEASFDLGEESSILAREGCPDLLDAGRIANLFFYAKKNVKWAAIRALLESRGSLSPVEEGLVWHYAPSDIPRPEGYYDNEEDQ
jgi:hypothetical protein